MVSWNGFPQRSPRPCFCPRLEALEDRDLLSFLAPVSYPVGGFTDYVAASDLNGDGTPDLIVSDDSSVGHVLVGNGDGTFQLPVDFAAGRNSFAVAVADFNGDGIPDLAVVDKSHGGLGNDSVYILLGNGDGTFQPASSYYLAPFADGVAVGDFNGDGIPDLAVTSYYSRRLYGLLGNGDGTFQVGPQYVAGIQPYGVVAGDFNGDGIPDLAVVNSSAPGGIDVFVGNGDGTFQDPQVYATGPALYSLAVGDFNGDGIPDLVATDYYGGMVDVLLGNGDGTFQAPVSYATGGTDVSSVAVGDFNGDGVVDLAVTNLGDAGSLGVLLGNGDGTFQAPTTYDAGAGPSAVAVADLNGDGYADLAVTDETSRSLAVLLNAADWDVSQPGLAPRANSFGSTQAPLNPVAPLAAHDQLNEHSLPSPSTRQQAPVSLPFVATINEAPAPRHAMSAPRALQLVGHPESALLLEADDLLGDRGLQGLR